MTDDRTSDSSAIYSQYLNEVLDNERVRRRDLQARGVGVITTASALATLFLGLLAVTGANTEAALPRPAHPLLGLATGLFALAAMAGIFSNLAPLHHDFADGEPEALAIRPTPTAEAAAANVIGWKLERLKSTQRNNRLRAWAVTVALTLEATGAVLLAVTVITTLAGATPTR